MGNCCGAPSAQEGGARKKDRRKQKQNPYTVAYNRPTPARPGLVVLRDPMGRDLDARHVLGGELGRGDFGVTYLCTEAATGARMACKSISKCKLRTPVDIEDMRREVEIMRHMPPHPNIVSLSAAYEDDDAVHLVIEARAASSSTGSLPGDTTPSAPPRPSCAPSSRSSGCATGMASSIGTLNQKTSYMQRRVLL